MFSCYAHIGVCAIIAAPFEAFLDALAKDVGGFWFAFNSLALHASIAARVLLGACDCHRLVIDKKLWWVECAAYSFIGAGYRTFNGCTSEKAYIQY